MSKKSATKRIDRAINRAEKLEGKVIEAATSGDGTRVHENLRIFLRSYDVAIACMAQAVQRLKRAYRPSNAKIVKLAEEVSVWQPSTETVRLDFKAKNGNTNDYRPIFVFGLRQQAAQIMAARALTVLVAPDKDQFLFNGGTTKAIEAVCEALEEGFHWVCETDIKSCYPSFDGEALPDCLPLAKEVTRSVLLCSSLNLVSGNFRGLLGKNPWSELEKWQHADFYSDLLAARRGIPQGSIVSPYVVEILLATLIAPLREMGCRVVVFADNIMILAKSESEMSSAVDCLRAALQAHPAGPLHPKVPKWAEPGEAFDFLGYRIDPNMVPIRVSPSPKNKAKFHSKHQALEDHALATDVPTFARLKRIRNIKRHVKSWTAGFPAWPSRQQFREKHLNDVEQLEKKVWNPLRKPEVCDEPK